jgi:Protein of unknown function (DUF3277)
MPYKLDRSQLFAYVSGNLIQEAGATDFIDAVAGGENTMIFGVDGNGGYVITADKSAMVRITVQEGSASNQILAAEYQKQKTLPGYLPTLYVKDGSGSYKLESTSACIKKIPDTKRGKDASENVWELMAVSADITL